MRSTLLSSTKQVSSKDTIASTSFIRFLSNRKSLLLLVSVLSLTFAVRFLTLQFMRAHLNDPGWFQTGSYAIFDRQAQAILDKQQPVYWINDSTRTDLAQYPPGFPAWVALIYKFTGEHSAFSVQTVQWILDLFLSTGLIAGIAGTAFGWRVLISSGFLFALSSVLALYAAYPSADTPTTWFVLGGTWLVLLAAKRSSVWLALAAGLLLGLACWIRVNPLYLWVAWALTLIVFVRASWRRSLLMVTALVSATLIVISPIVIRNYLVFPDFTPTGGTIGTNLWEGLGETELGRDNGFAFGDEKMLERERIKLGLSPDAKLEAQWPDGIRRDRERTRESLNFIKQHPIWYGGVMLRRMWGMLKIAGAPVPYSGTCGINVTSAKTLPAEWQGGVVAFVVNLLGMIQSLSRYLFLPLAVFGMYIASRRDRVSTAILLATVLYYLVPGTAAHTEIRYVLPMHALLIVFAGVAVDNLLKIKLAQ